VLSRCSSGPAFAPSSWPDPSRLDPAIRGEVDAVAVDQYDDDAVTAATAGVDALFWVDHTTGSDDPLADYDRADQRGPGRP